MGIDITRHKHSISPEASSRSAFHKRRRKTVACWGTGDRRHQTWEGSQWREQQIGLQGASARLSTEGSHASLHDGGEAGPSIKPSISSHSDVIRSRGCTEQGTWDLLNCQLPQISDDKHTSNDRALSALSSPYYADKETKAVTHLAKVTELAGSRAGINPRLFISKSYLEL